MISIVTPWLNASNLCPVYERSNDGAQAIIVDNGSDWQHALKLEAMAARMNGVYIRNKDNNRFAPANNQGLQAATGDIVMFLNNDTEAPRGWLAQVARDVEAGALCGPSLLNKHGVDYIEGYCIAATRDTWDKIGGWPEDLPGMYWEDNILCLRASRLGVRMKRTTWPVFHAGNYTSGRVPGAFDASQANESRFLELLQCQTNTLR